MQKLKNMFTRRARPLRGPVAGNEVAVAEANFVAVNPKQMNLLNVNATAKARKKIKNLKSKYNALNKTRNTNLSTLINLAIQRDQLKAALAYNTETGRNVSADVAELNRMNFESLYGRNRASTNASDPRPPSPGPAERRRKRKTRRSRRA
jgi:hypothetical protein